MPTSMAHRNRVAAQSHPTAKLPIDDTRIREIMELVPPAHLLREFPERHRRAQDDARQAIHRAPPDPAGGRRPLLDSRLLDAAIDYATRLAALRRAIRLKPN